MIRKQRTRIGVWGIFMLIFLLSMALMWPVNGRAEEKAPEEKAALGTVIVTVERQTISEGYYLAPVAVPFYEGDNGLNILDRALKGETHYQNSTDAQGNKKGIASIVGADTGEAVIPESLLARISKKPSTPGNEALGKDQSLGAGAYTPESAWYTVVNHQPWENMAQYAPTDGDVLRLCFSLLKDGGDIQGENTPNPDALIKLILTAKASPYGEDEGLVAAVDLALTHLQSYDTTQEELDATITAIQAAADAAVKKAQEPPDVSTEVAQPVDKIGAVTQDAEEAEPEISTASPAPILKKSEFQTPAVSLFTQKEEETTAAQGSTAIREMITSSAAGRLSLFENSPPSLGTSNGEWTILCLARSGLGNQNLYDTYYENIRQRVVDKKGVLDRVKYTEYSRLILGLTAIGRDVTNVGGYNLLTYLSDFDKVKKQGINGPIWALIALDSHDYELPEVAAGGNQNSRKKMVEYILSREVSGGGWTLSGEVADADMTAMAILALDNHRDMAGVPAAIGRGMAVLEDIQIKEGGDAGGYASWGTTNSESTAQVIIALTACGVDVATDSRFIKGDATTLSALGGFYIKDTDLAGGKGIMGDGFMHVKPGAATGGGGAAGVWNDMATDQAMEALISYQRVKEGKTSIFDMADVGITATLPKYLALNETKGVFDAKENTSLQLSTTVDPQDVSTDYTITWSSTNEAVATVDQNGRVTIKAQGDLPEADANLPRATITATLKAVDQGGSTLMTLEASYDVYMGMNADGVMDLLADLPGAAAFNGNDRDALIFASRAYSYLSELDKKQVDTQKLTDDQRVAQAMNQKKITTFTTDAGLTIYPKTIALITTKVDVPWYVELVVGDATAESVAAITTAAAGKTVEQVCDISLYNRMADDPQTAYIPSEALTLKMEVPETQAATTSTADIVHRGDTGVETLASTLQGDRRAVVFATKSFSTFAYVTGAKSTGGGSGGNHNGGTQGSGGSGGIAAGGGLMSSGGGISYSSNKSTTSKVVSKGNEKKGLTLGNSGIGMVDITGTGNLSTRTTTTQSFLNALGEKMKEDALPFLIGGATMGIILCGGYLIHLKGSGKKY